MEDRVGKLTVYFENPFWVGVFERTENGALTACKVTFGAEPKDCEVWEYVLKNYGRLSFSPPVEAAVGRRAANPKRLQRQTRRQIDESGVGTRAQQALQRQREAHRLERRTMSREQREAEKQRQFDLSQQKRKEKHRGH